LTEKIAWEICSISFFDVANLFIFHFLWWPVQATNTVLDGGRWLETGGGEGKGAWMVHFILLVSTPLKKVREFPVPSRDVTTKLSLGRNNDVIIELFLPRGSLFSDIPAGDGKLVNLYLQCNGLWNNGWV
jgi:hypothetical protein